MSLAIGHLVVTWFMVGILWMVQVVHYPLFASVGIDHFTTYEQRHTRRMGALIAIPAVTEVVLALLLVIARPSGVETWAVWTAGAVLAGIWIVTLLTQVPLHRRLSRRHDGRLIAALVRSNWVRTVAWTGRGVLALTFVA